MKQVIIDRGVYKLGRKNSSTGESTEPQWESTERGRTIVIGHEGDEFSISTKDDIKFVLKELSERLELDFLAKVEKDDFGIDGEYYKCSRCQEVFDNQEVPYEGERQFCYNCGAVLDWSDFIQEEE